MSQHATAPRKRQNPLGRLTALGPREPWQVALLLPTRWDDLRHYRSDFNFDGIPDETQVLLRGRLAAAPTLSFDSIPKLTGRLLDDHGQRIGFTFFGDTRETQADLTVSSDECFLLGNLIRLHGHPWLSSPEFIPRSWLGKLRPVYPGKPKTILPATVRERVLALLQAAIPQAAAFLRASLDEEQLHQALSSLGLPLERLLWLAHRPRTLEEGQQAQEAIERLAALGSLQKAREHATTLPDAPWHSPADWQHRAASLPFALTPDQQTAIEEIAADLCGPKPMRRLLNGDVGTGKTAVFGLAVAACLDGGGRVAILLPNERLAEQVSRSLSTWWPDLAPLLVTGTTTHADEVLAQSRLLIGTTALLHRPVGTFALVVIDEQQKFSREQREALTQGAHVLEASATCIPRSQALAKYGIVQVSRLTTGHVAKDLHTRIWTNDEQRMLFAELRRTIEEGHQVIVVYPRKQNTLNEDGVPEDTRIAAAPAFALWQNLFPDQVVLAHGGQDEEVNQNAMEAMRTGRASILIATTVAEVGIDLPGVRRVMVVRPEFLGLTQLHQLRGRAARTGGEGWFDLYLPSPVKDETMNRLQTLVDSQNGFEIATQDMALRGFGDLGCDSNKQSGSDDTFLFGRPVRVDLLEELLAEH